MLPRLQRVGGDCAGEERHVASPPGKSRRPAHRGTSGAAGGSGQDLHREAGGRPLVCRARIRGRGPRTSRDRSAGRSGRRGPGAHASRRSVHGGSGRAPEILDPRRTAAPTGATRGVTATEGVASTREGEGAACPMPREGEGPAAGLRPPAHLLVGPTPRPHRLRGPGCAGAPPGNLPETDRGRRLGNASPHGRVQRSSTVRPLRGGPYEGDDPDLLGMRPPPRPSTHALGPHVRVPVRPPHGPRPERGEEHPRPRSARSTRGHRGTYACGDGTSTTPQGAASSVEEAGTASRRGCSDLRREGSPPLQRGRGCHKRKVKIATPT